MHPDGLWFSSATGGLHHTPEYNVPLRFAVAFLCYQCDHTDCISKCQCETQGRNIEDTAHLGCRFPLIHFIHQKDLQSLLIKCYFFLQNDYTIHEYSCTLSTYPNSNEIIMCRVAPRKSMKRQYFIS